MHHLHLLEFKLKGLSNEKVDEAFACTEALKSRTRYDLLGNSNFFSLPALHPSYIHTAHIMLSTEQPTRLHKDRIVNHLLDVLTLTAPLLEWHAYGRFTANPDYWNFDPFSMSIDGDKLHGRGTTDCLGHVALVTELMKKLGQEKPSLKSTVVAVFIASEENTTTQGVGVDQIMKDGVLDDLKNGPL
ncbi:hypothetical protein Tsubulata_031032 [Turnera subulata]|uniref:Uncharacterized protein n=1 Tax=Turnera subulata TaxID=218843 RepID=A0A9Q0GFG6_9ROSI|nr:hypothetical protein Tsubulata_031032 [Turnera subulata]